MTTTPTRETIIDSLRRLAESGSGCPVLPPYQDKSEKYKVETYGVINLISSEQSGGSWSDYNNDQETRHSFVESVFSMNWYNNGAFDCANNFKMWADSNNGREQFANRLFALRNVSDIIDITGIDSDKYEQRAQCDVTVAYAIQHTKSANELAITDVNLNGVGETRQLTIGV